VRPDGSREAPRRRPQPAPRRHERSREVLYASAARRRSSLAAQGGGSVAQIVLGAATSSHVLGRNIPDHGRSSARRMRFSAMASSSDRTRDCQKCVWAQCSALIRASCSSASSMGNWSRSAVNTRRHSSVQNRLGRPLGLRRNSACQAGHCLVGVDVTYFPPLCVRKSWGRGCSATPNSRCMTSPPHCQPASHVSSTTGRSVERRPPRPSACALHWTDRRSHRTGGHATA
jgi:hypothetical protein